MNELGYVIGQSQAADKKYHAFRWTASTGSTDLPDSSLGVWSEAHAINQRGQAVGIAAQPGGISHAFMWGP